MTLLLKKIQTSLLLILIAVPLLFGAFFGIRQKITQWQMQEELETATAETLTVSLADFKWITGNKEAVIKGKLFDVKQFEIKGNTITVTGLYDDKEDELANQAAKLISEGRKQNNPGNPVLLKLLFQQLYYCCISFEHLTAKKIICKPLIVLSEKIISAYLNKIIQPPRQFVC